MNEQDKKLGKRCLNELNKFRRMNEQNKNLSERCLNDWIK